MILWIHLQIERAVIEAIAEHRDFTVIGFIDGYITRRENGNWISH